MFKQANTKIFTRTIAILLSMVLVLILLPLTAVAADDYPYASYGDGVDPYNFYYRQCTSFVAFRLNNNNGVHFTNQYMGVSRWGNANNWGSVAKNLGIAVDKTPAVGAVAWWDTGTYGHVAWVSSVNGDNVTIEEYNRNWDGKYSTRTISKSSVSGYIHIKDIFINSNSVIDNGTYFVKNAANPNQALNVYTASTPKNKDEVTLYPFNRNDSAQKWIFEKVGDATVIRTVNSNIVLNVYNINAARNNDNVNVLTYDSSDNCQLWIIESVGNNQYIIRSNMNRDVVLAPSGTYKNQADVRLQTYTGTDSQKWLLEKE